MYGWVTLNTGPSFRICMPINKGCTYFQSKERLELLEEAIVGAQTRESQMLEMTSWMSEVSDMLHSRLEADILAGDVPAEYEVSCSL